MAGASGPAGEQEKSGIIIRLQAISPPRSQHSWLLQMRLWLPVRCPE